MNRCGFVETPAWPPYSVKVPMTAGSTALDGDGAVIRATGGLPTAAILRVLGLWAVLTAVIVLGATVGIGDATGGLGAIVGPQANRLVIRTLWVSVPLAVIFSALHLAAGAGRIPLVTLRRRDGVASLRFHLAWSGLFPRTMPLEGSVTLSLGYDPTKPGWDVVGASAYGRVVRMSTLGIVPKSQLDAMAEAIRAAGVRARVIVKEPRRPTTPDRT